MGLRVARAAAAAFSSDCQAIRPVPGSFFSRSIKPTTARKMTARTKAMSRIEGSLDCDPPLPFGLRRTGPALTSVLSIGELPSREDDSRQDEVERQREDVRSRRRLEDAFSAQHVPPGHARHQVLARQGAELRQPG